MASSPIKFYNDVTITGILTISASSGYIDFNNQEAKKLIVYNTTGASYTGAVGGALLYDSSRAADKRLGYYDGSTWQYPSNDRASHTGTQTASTISDFTTTTRATVLSGYALGTNAILATTDTIEGAFGKVQAQINAKISGNQTITVSGDATGSGTTAISLTLANSGATAGTYTKVTVNAKGLVTGATNLADTDLPTHASRHKSGGADAIKLNELAVPTASVDLNSQKIINLLDPVNAQDAATKNYVDNVASGMKWKSSVKVATTANGTLSTAYANAQVVDGITLATGDRILIKDQTTTTENGIYTVNATGAPTRASDADTWSELISASVFVESGTVNADTGWNCTVNSGGTFGSTAISFAQFTGAGAITAGAGLTKSSNTLDIGTDGSITVNADTIGINANYKVKTYSGSVTGTTATSYTVTHNLGLATATDVEVSVYEGGTRVFPSVVCSTTNAISLEFKTAPNGQSFSVICIGKVA